MCLCPTDIYFYDVCLLIMYLIFVSMIDVCSALLLYVCPMSMSTYARALPRYLCGDLSSKGRLALHVALGCVPVWVACGLRGCGVLPAWHLRVVLDIKTSAGHHF